MTQLVTVRLLKDTKTAKKGKTAKVDQVRADQWIKDGVAEKAGKNG